MYAWVMKFPENPYLFEGSREEVENLRKSAQVFNTKSEAFTAYEYLLDEQKNKPRYISDEERREIEYQQWVYHRQYVGKSASREEYDKKMHRELMNMSRDNEMFSRALEEYKFHCQYTGTEFVFDRFLENYRQWLSM